MRHRIRSVIAIAIGVGLGWWAAGCMHGAKVLARFPSTTSTTTQAVIAPEALEMQSRWAKEHHRFNVTRVRGKSLSEIEAAGRKIRYEDEIIEVIASDGRYRADSKDRSVIAYDLKQQIRYDVQQRRYQRFEGQAKADSQIGSLLQTGKLGFDPTDPYVRISVGGADTIVIHDGLTQSKTTIRYDPALKQIVEVEIQFKAALERTGVPGIRRATQRITYATVEDASDVPADFFSFEPPADATNLPGHKQGELLEGERPPMIGQPLPDATLATPDGKQQKLSDLRGKVILLDFWATWCGPCRNSLSHVDELVTQYKDKVLKGFAVNIAKEPT